MLTHDGLNSQSDIATLANPPKPLQGLKALIVDDCESNQFLFKHLLVRKGASVTLADNGYEGLRLALENAYDVVLMDIQMPVMDGYSALEKLKASGYKNPVIALTAHSKQEERQKIVAAGFSAHVTKPVDVKTLISIIQDIVPKNMNRTQAAL